MGAHVAAFDAPFSGFGFAPHGVVGIGAFGAKTRFRQAEIALMWAK